jgi:microcystin-dependent protein
VADPFVGEIRIMANNFAPNGWAYCNGQSIPIQQNSALFSIIGVAFGGNGTTTFNLPNFSGAAPIGAGQGSGLSQVSVGEFNGAADVTLTLDTMPPHNHSLSGRSAAGDQSIPGATLYPAVDAGSGGTENIFYAAPGASVTNTTMYSGSLVNSGLGQSHPNTQPYLALGFCICLNGEYPARN